MNQRAASRRALALLITTALGIMLLIVAATPSLARPKTGTQTQLPTTVEDFFEPGTQENTLSDPLLAPQSCRVCHQFEPDGNPNELVPPYDNWVMSIMAQASRDPIWHAALAVANQDLAFGGDTCIRCHAPNAWLGGRSVPTDGSAMTGSDFNGVSCNFCHRLVDPIPAKENPPEDDSILAALAADGLLPAMPGNARFVVDPQDTRRGPIPYCGEPPYPPDCPDDAVPSNYHGVPILESPFHHEGNLCGTCHDVSNAVFTRNAKGRYVLNAYDAAHPTLDPHQMMPEQRTYSEWLNSDFANGGVYFPDRRFGGEHPTGIMESCQDCHMPKYFGGLCTFWQDDPFFPRPDIPQHSFIGANTWVLAAVYAVYGQSETGLTPKLVDLARQRTQTMLRNASDMQVVQLGDQLKVRIINFSGHKLPTGYPEGRRMWINVQFFDDQSMLIGELGAYDFDAAELTTTDTKVYEARFGMTKSVSGATGLPSGQSFHLVLNNRVLKDNRIPPMGFTNAAFDAVRAAPAAHSYQDGQYWDDTLFNIPEGTAEALVTLYYQTTSKEYIEFLRDANKTNTAGQDAYDLWLAHGKSAPVDMDMLLIPLGPSRHGDLNHDGFVNVTDLLIVIQQWGACPPPELCEGDTNCDGQVNVTDLLTILMNWG